ncbi:MAG TPA: hypothetical protein VJ647_02310 [Chitinophagaceae bacterium]|nr:hypothetical protein [Chitinophagaceae bacterium]
MKKLLLVLAIGAFAACGGNSNTEETKADSTLNVVDSTINAVSDSATAVIDSTANAAKDSINAVADPATKH